MCGMYELSKAGEKSYYINCPAKIGIYTAGDNEVYLIDSGNDNPAVPALRYLRLLCVHSVSLQAQLSKQ